jgi:hypothetical protein
MICGQRSIDGKQMCVRQPLHEGRHEFCEAKPGPIPQYFGREYWSPVVEVIGWDTHVIVDREPNFHVVDTRGDRACQIRCVVCGAGEFQVGAGEYLTAVRCMHCKWELVIHSG